MKLIGKSASLYLSFAFSNEIGPELTLPIA